MQQRFVLSAMAPNGYGLLRIFIFLEQYKLLIFIMPGNTIGRIIGNIGRLDEGYHKIVSHPDQ
jgi:hypothetical protein